MSALTTSADPAREDAGPEPSDGDYAVVVPTIGRPCLADCLRALADSAGPAPRRIIVVDDRPGPADTRAAPDLSALGGLRDRAEVLCSGGRGPAAARNAGWKRVTEPWVAFLDDDVRVAADWRSRIGPDLAACGPSTAGTQGELLVPLPSHRRPTDWERGTAGLSDARWVTADMAYRTAALAAVGGFDERFPRAFREDADLALRLLDGGWELRRGGRRTEHPVRDTDWRASVRAQRGNADDALMTAVHGRDWWRRAEAPRGRIRRHTLVTSALLLAPALRAAGRPRAAAAAVAVWLLGTAEFAAARIAPGPRTAQESLTMLATSAVIPPLAVGHRLRGELRHRLPGSGGGR